MHGRLNIRRNVGIQIHYTHSQPHGLLSQRLCYSAESNQPQRHAIEASNRPVTELMPIPTLHVRVRLNQLAHECQHQAKRMLADLVPTVVRYVGYYDVSSFRRGDVNVVDPDAK